MLYKCTLELVRVSRLGARWFFDSRLKGAHSYAG